MQKVFLPNFWIHSSWVFDTWCSQAAATGGVKQPGTLALRETGGRLGVPGRQGQEAEEEGHQLPGRAQCTGRGEAASQVQAWHRGPEGDWRPSWSTCFVQLYVSFQIFGWNKRWLPWGQKRPFSNWGLITPIAGPCYTQRKARWHFHTWRQLGLEQRTRLVRSPALLFSYLLSYPFYFHKANVHKRFLSYPFSYLFSCPFS